MKTLEDLKRQGEKALLTRDHYYIAIRKAADTGKEWFDTDTLSVLPGETYRKARALNERLPIWGKDNPVVRIVKVMFVEMEEACIENP